MFYIKKQLTVVAIFLLGLFLFSTGASAHVTVKPTTSTTNTWETYTVTVPVEKDVATTKVTVQIPNGVQFELTRSMPEWTTKINKDEKNQQVSTITWEAKKDGIQPGEFEKFEFIAKNPGKAATIAWNAIQYYSDGTSVSWTGGAGSATPYSITTISTANQSNNVSDTNTDHGHSHNGHHGDNSDKNNSSSRVEKEASSSVSPWISIVLSGGALLLSCIALWVGLRRSK
jgi:uncharacterized protein YcnI